MTDLPNFRSAAVGRCFFVFLKPVKVWLNIPHSYFELLYLFKNSTTHWKDSFLWYHCFWLASWKVDTNSYKNRFIDKINMQNLSKLVLLGNKWRNFTRFSVLVSVLFTLLGWLRVLLRKCLIIGWGPQNIKCVMKSDRVIRFYFLII